MTTQTKPELGIKNHIKSKRDELIWALAQQDYSDSEIASIFNITRQRVQVIRSSAPKGWSSPWIKITNKPVTQAIRVISKQDTDGGKLIQGHCLFSGGEFSAFVEGSGNSTTYRFTFTGGQYDIYEEQTEITIMGEWEMMQVAEVINLIAPRV